MIRKTLLACAAVLGLSLAAAPAFADELIGSYNAFLSRADHYNSQGQRLTSAAAIIRQDRANFHKFGIQDPSDESDDYFDNVNNRALLERMLNDGRSDPAVLREIVNNNVMIHVDIYRSDHGDYVIVTLLNSPESGY
ncbi:MAG: hypothetical protein ISS15_14145 [Alphaproteobacteria bacterium]|nr:hypothetical protein [Alphaproteobacteria bacterium]MBL6937457.1 hypothetical protein [Alphaproteobacteria bacterium]MBL7098795.1 hypothetical protein [Alphaproteobacteria bacterium]